MGKMNENIENRQCLELRMQGGNRKINGRKENKVNWDNRGLRKENMIDIVCTVGKDWKKGDYTFSTRNPFLKKLASYLPKN